MQFSKKREKKNADPILQFTFYSHWNFRLACVAFYGAAQRLGEVKKKNTKKPNFRYFFINIISVHLHLNSAAHMLWRRTFCYSL